MLTGFCLLLLLESALAQDAFGRCAANGITVPRADFDACGLDVSDLWGDNSELFVTKKCTDPACQRIYAYLAAAYPSDCILVLGVEKTLHRSVLDPLAKSCAELKRATTAPPATSPSAEMPTTPLPTAPTPSSTTPAPASTTSEPSLTTPAPSTTAPVSTATSAIEADTPSTTRVDNAAQTNSSTIRENMAEESLTPSSDTTTAPPAATATMSASPQSSSPIVAWVIGAIAALSFAFVAVFCGLRIRRRHGAQSTPPPAGSHTSIPTNDTTDSTPYVAISSSISQRHHKEMDDLLLQDRKIATWRLFSAHVRNVKFLGKGSHAFVHLVELANGSLFASKRLALDQATPKHLQQLLTEVHIVATLSHASVVQFKGVTWTDAMDFQVLFEYMRGGDLRHYLDKQRQSSSPFTAEWTPLKLQIALSIAEGLVYAHSFTSPLVHRDLKSRNILLTEELRAKISDFGVSRFQSENDTMTTGVGTNRWLAPEVLVGGGAYNEKCDIYSFGVVMTELDTHEVPLERELAVLRSTTTDGGRNKSEMWVLREFVNGTLRPSMSTSAPPEVRSIAERCMSFDVRDRPDALELSYVFRKMIEKE